MNYRHEYKFLVNSADLELLRGRICPLLRPDVHQSGKNGYVITSVYFDSLDDRCWNENLQGYDHRHKFRIRIYDHNTQTIKLERKSKVRNLGNKTAVMLSQSECCKFLEGYIPPIKEDFSSLKKELFCQMQLEGMQPKCIVQYEREAFIYPAGNIRITFDKNISGSLDINTFMDQQIPAIPVLNNDVHVLEVKYDAFLPGFLGEALGIDRLLHTTMSKYAQTRNILG